MNMNVEMEKRLAVVLSNPLDADVGRNEKIRSRLKHFEEGGWRTKTFVVEDPDTDNFLLNLLFILFRCIIATLKLRAYSKQKEKIVIWSMNSPAFLHLPALLVKFFSNNVKWVAEFRDAMCTEPFYSTKSFGRRLTRSLLEAPTVKYADRILFPIGGKSSKEYFKANYPQNHYKAEYTAYQGYNKEEFNNIKRNKFDKYTITYAGRLYDDWITPISFLKGFAKFVKENNLSIEDIQVLFYVKGWRKEYTDLANELNIKKYIKIKGFVSNDKIKNIIGSSDLVLYIAGSKISNKNMIHSKFYDYIGSKRPLLALSEEGSKIYEFVYRFNLGYFAKEYNTGEISQALFIAYNENFPGYKDTDEVNEKFDREKIIKRFYEVIDSV